MTEAAKSQMIEEERFRSSLEDVVALIDGLGTYCETPAEMSEMAKLALTNRAQTRLLIAAVTPPKNDAAKRS